MFEVIGFVVVAWFAWLIFKAVVAKQTGALLQRAANYAELHGGVPRAFSAEVLDSPSEVKAARQALATGDSDFGALDGYKQYGRVIMKFYEGRRANVELVKDHMEKDAFGPQCARLPDISACPISAMYVMTLTSCLSPMMPTADEMREVYDHCFRHGGDDSSRENAWVDAMNSRASQENMDGMGRLVGREMKSKKYEFFYKLRQRQMADNKLGIDETALALADPQWYLKL